MALQQMECGHIATTRVIGERSTTKRLETSQLQHFRGTTEILGVYYLFNLANGSLDVLVPMTQIILVLDGQIIRSMVEWPRSLTSSKQARSTELALPHKACSKPPNPENIVVLRSDWFCMLDSQSRPIQRGI